LKRIIYTVHALKRMRERGITKEEVTTCLRSPDKELTMNSEKKAIKRLNNKAIVITTYVTSKIYKYLRR